MYITQLVHPGPIPYAAINIATASGGGTTAVFNNKIHDILTQNNSSGVFRQFMLMVRPVQPQISIIMKFPGCRLTIL